jgi:hypothetical protein
MTSDSDDSLERWIRTLPFSRIVFPKSFFERFKYIIWRIYGPMHPVVRDFLVLTGIARHTVSRQDFLIGNLKEPYSFREVITSLIGQGYRKNRIGWKDDGEVISLRFAANFTYQYHIRIFEDGEVRGHYEYTPESHPWRHIMEIGFEDRREEFLRVLGDHIVPQFVSADSRSHLS